VIVAAFTQPVDCWSWPQYECCTGRYPFEAQNEGALIRKILRGQYSKVTGNYSPSMAQLVDVCLTVDWKRRPDARQLLAMAAVKAKARPQPPHTPHPASLRFLFCPWGVHVWQRSDMPVLGVQYIRTWGNCVCLQACE
jgi:serine/threonine protein kinase